MLCLVLERHLDDDEWFESLCRTADRKTYVLTEMSRDDSKNAVAVGNDDVGALADMMQLGKCEGTRGSTTPGRVATLGLLPCLF